jgi:hypothetical protein
MQVRSAVRSFVTLSLLMLAYGPGNAYNQSAIPSQGDTVDEWVHDNYGVVVRSVLPERLKIAPFPVDTKWIAVILVKHPFASAEYWVSVRKKYDGTSKATIMIPHHESLATQMKALKQKNPAATADMIGNMLSVDKFEFSDTDIPELRDTIKEFERIRIAPVMPDLLGTDLFEYDLWTESQYGQEMSVQLVGFGPGAKKQPHPLVEWTERLRAVGELYLKRHR